MHQNVTAYISIRATFYRLTLKCGLKMHETTKLPHLRPNDAFKKSENPQILAPLMSLTQCRQGKSCSLKVAFCFSISLMLHFLTYRSGKNGRFASSRVPKMICDCILLQNLITRQVYLMSDRVRAHIRAKTQNIQ